MGRARPVTESEAMVPEPIDDRFLSLPRHELADAALARASRLGAQHADFRLELLRDQAMRLRDGRLESSGEGETSGFAVRVVADGSWGFAAGVELTTDEAARVATQAVEVARTSRAINSEPVELADEPSYGDATWVSDYQVNPFDVPESDKQERLREWSARLLAAEGVSHVDAELLAVQENKFYADLAGTVTTQQRVRIAPELTAVWIDPAGGRFDTMRTLAPPAGRGYEYLDGTGWDWERELEELPALLLEKSRAPSVEAGTYDKNKELDPGYVDGVLEKYKLDPQRPILTQISRFDRLKDPLGVIRAYRMVRRRFDCQLVLAGGGASDDPEGEAVLREVQEAAAEDPDVHVRSEERRVG